MKATKKSLSHNAKEKQVKELTEEIKKSKTLMIVSTKKLPSKQFQEIKKSIRDISNIKVAKKNIMLRAINSLKDENAIKLEKFIENNCAFLISNIDGFELAGILLSKKIPVFAKAGQIAESDIEVKEGSTNLVPGPAISELGALGIQISVEEGKIAIKKSKTVVKAGEPISASVCAILQKLNIQPFLIGLDPIAIYEVQTGKVYTEIDINPGKARNEIISSAKIAIGFANRIGYFCKETIRQFLIRAELEANAINKKIN